jgi:hypothetical protein
MGMVRQEYHYIVCGFGINELRLKDYIYSGVQISGFEVVGSPAVEREIRDLLKELRATFRSTDSEQTDDEVDLEDDGNSPSVYDVLHVCMRGANFLYMYLMYLY